jgi:hypothetical protein
MVSLDDEDRAKLIISEVDNAIDRAIQVVETD